MLLVLIGIGVPAIVFAVSVWGRNLFCPAAIVGAGYFCRFDRDQPETLPKSWGRAAAWIAGWTAASLPEAFPHKPSNGGTSQQIDQQYGPLSVAVGTNGIEWPLAFYLRRGKVLRWDDFPAEKEKRFYLSVAPEVRRDRKRGLSVPPNSSKRRWGRSNGKDPEITQLDLYEIDAIRPR